MERRPRLATTSASCTTLVAGLGLFAAPFLTGASDVAAAFEASFAALVIVLGYDLVAAARRGSARRAGRARATAEVIETSTAAYLAVALLDWLLGSVVAVPAALGVLALAATATASARATARRLTRRWPR